MMCGVGVAALGALLEQDAGIDPSQDEDVLEQWAPTPGSRTSSGPWVILPGRAKRIHNLHSFRFIH